MLRRCGQYQGSRLRYQLLVHAQTGLARPGISPNNERAVAARIAGLRVMLLILDLLEGRWMNLYMCAQMDELELGSYSV